MTEPRSLPDAVLAAATGAAGLAACIWLAFQAYTLELRRPGLQGWNAAAGALQPCRMDPEGFWTGRIFGAAVVEFDWRGARLDCAGNARPDGRGLRLFLAGRPAASRDRLLLVIGIAASLAEVAEIAGPEHPVSVTLVDERSSQFFHGPEGRCFTRIRAVAPLPDAAGSYRVEGDLYCAGAIAAVTAPGSVTLGDMRFAGRLDLEQP